MAVQSNNNGKGVKCRHTPRAAVLTFKEKRIYDVSAVETVEMEVRAILAEEPPNMIINFAGVDFMVTRVINILLVALKNIRSRGGEVFLVGMNQNIRRVFNLMRLNVVFRIFDTEELALAALDDLN